MAKNKEKINAYKLTIYGYPQTNKWWRHRAVIAQTRMDIK